MAVKYLKSKIEKYRNTILDYKLKLFSNKTVKIFSILIFILLISLLFKKNNPKNFLVSDISNSKFKIEAIKNESKELELNNENIHQKEAFKSLEFQTSDEIDKLISEIDEKLKSRFIQSDFLEENSDSENINKSENNTKNYTDNKTKNEVNNSNPSTTYEKNVDPENPDGLVEYEMKEDFSLDFSERRKSYSIIMGFNYSPLETSKFRSELDAFTYSELFGSSTIPFVQGQIGIKYNTLIGSVSLEGIIGDGTVTDSRSGEKRTLHLFKKGGATAIYLDTLFKEPYVVPYGAFQFFELDYEDKGEEDNTKGTTEVSTGYTAGLLVQLNWLDPDPADFARRNHGLQNTYLDLFISALNTSQSKNDPDFQTSLTWGAGLKMEF